MIIERNFSKYVVFVEDSLLIALKKISENKSRLIFAVTESGVLEGILSDGDLRRWLIATKDIDLNIPVSLLINRQYRAAHADDDLSKIKEILSHRIIAVPILDSNQRLIAVALPQDKYISVGGKIISEESDTFVIAEIGNNHNGSLVIAKRLIDAAAKSGADSVKFQMRDMASLYINSGDCNDDSADLGAQYTLDLLSRFQLTDSDMFKAFDYCQEKNIIPLCTPWDIVSLEKLESYGLCAYKVASADFTNYELLDAVVAKGKPVICSTGMVTESEIRESVNRLRNSGASFVLLHCNSTYPTPFKDVNLKYMVKLKEFGDCLYGYSGHERDINVAIAAVALGANVIEKHLTLDRDMEGNDHKISLLPDEFTRMVNAIRQTEEALGSDSERIVSQGEMINRENLAKSLVAAVDISEGTIINEEMVKTQSPGQGLQPNRKKDLIGRVARTAKKVGDFFYASDLEEYKVRARDYSFRRSWGMPVRYHDLQKIVKMSNVKLLEIHLSYKDMEKNFHDYLLESLDLELVVHAPELYAGDHTLDLCSADENYRKRSIAELQRVIDLTRLLTPYFKHTQRPFIVTNVGGFSHDGHLYKRECEILLSVLSESLSQLDLTGVEIIPQTMPPFPWHFGGQQFHNLFVDAESIVQFCRDNQMRICLDVSHSKLACNYLKQSFSSFLRQVGPYVAHMHLADAKGVDGEGLQVGEGEIDWSSFFELIDEYAPSASFIPEIWQGHKNDCEGAWLALERLEISLN